MPSRARSELNTRLRDVDELIMAHTRVTGGVRGRPAERQGAAITRAGVVLLSAATEAFVEDLFEEAATIIFAGMAGEDLDRLFKNTSKRLNNADVHKTEMLFFNLGFPWILHEISWRKYPNRQLRCDLDELIKTRGSIAHGRSVTVRLQRLRRWRNMIDMLATRFEQKVAEQLQRTAGRRPDW